MATLRFIRKPVEIRNLPGHTLLQAAHRAGVVIRHPCGGKGLCGACTVRIRSGSVNAPTLEERTLLGEEKISQGFRLACLARAEDDAEIELL